MALPLSLSFFNDELSVEQKTDIYYELTKSPYYYRIMSDFYDYGIRY